MSINSTSTPRTWPLIAVGILFLLLGPAIYITQIMMNQLVTPWYLPILASLGVVLMTAAFVRRPSVLRGIVVALALLPTVFAWLVVAVFSRTPDYAGPASVGNKLPAFAASYSDGRAFTNDAIEAGGPAVLLFYRGHW